jgi:chitodextrinase
VTACLLAALLIAGLIPFAAVAAGPIASSTFVGVEDPLSESGAWAALTSLSPSGGRFQKNNGAFPDKGSPDHAGSRTTAVVPADHYSEIVVGHLGSASSQVGPIVRVQTSAPSIDSHYLWWASLLNGANALYRVDANGTSYAIAQILATSPVADGDRLRLIARGPVIYGIKNGAREFIYNTGRDTTRYSTGTTGMLAWTADSLLTNAKIAAWSTDAAPVSSGTSASSTFVGVENPLDEGDRWYPLPGYSGFRKAGVAVGRDPGHNASGAWSITPAAKQYSEVTLGTVASGGGGPIVRIDRTNAGQTGWLLFLLADNPSLSGIYKMNPDGGFTAARLFTPIIVSGDKWRLTADLNTLDVARNGVSQFTFTTDNSYATGDVGIETYTPAFTLAGWAGGDAAAPGDTTPPTAPSNASATATSSTQISLSWTASTDNVGVKEYWVERCPGNPCSASFAQVGTAASSPYSDSGLASSTTYSYQVRATDAAGNLSPYSNVTSATTQTPPDTEPPSAPGPLLATPAIGPQIDLTWTAATDNVAVTGYIVERCAGIACGDFLPIVTVSGTSYSDTGLAATTSYSYRVRATDAAGNLGPYSNVTTAITLALPDVTPPTAPSNLVPLAVGTNRIRLVWTASTDDVGVTAYIVERCQGIACTGFVRVATAVNAPYDDAGLAVITTYRYRVRATDAAGNLSPYSNVVTATTLALLL